MTTPERQAVSYAICATPRTGSYLLCEGLRSTGLAGKPTEYLSPSYEQYWMPRWKVGSYPGYLAKVREVGATANGVFGVKVHPVQLDHFCRRMSGTSRATLLERRALLEEAFGDLRYVWVKRADKVGQGISYAKALQSRIWWDTDKAPAPYDAPWPEAIRFDRALLERCITQMHVEEARWQAYFDDNDIEPLVITYETMVEDVPDAVSRVAGHLGLKLPDDFQLPPSRFRLQADSVTREWREKLTAAVVNDPAIKMVRKAAPKRALPAEPVNLSGMLASRRWWRSDKPFAHVRAENVFTAQAFEAMEQQFRTWAQEGCFGRDIPGYDVSAMAVTTSQ